MPGDGTIPLFGDSFWGPKLSEAVLNASLPVDRLNDMVRPLYMRRTILDTENDRSLESSQHGTSLDRTRITRPPTSPATLKAKRGPSIQVLSSHPAAS